MPVLIIAALAIVLYAVAGTKRKGDTVQRARRQVDSAQRQVTAAQRNSSAHGDTLMLRGRGQPLPNGRSSGRGDALTPPCGRPTASAGGAVWISGG